MKASIRAVLEDVISSEPELIRDAMMRGLRAAPPRSFQYVQLAAHYVDGKPEDRLEIRNLANLSDPELEQLEALLALAPVPPESVHRRFSRAVFNLDMASLDESGRERPTLRPCCTKKFPAVGKTKR